MGRFRQPRASQRRHVQSFQRHRLVLTDQPQSQLVVVIQSDLSHLPVQDGDLTPGLLSIHGSFLLPSQGPLGPSQGAFLDAQPLRVRNLFPGPVGVDDGGQVGQPHIYPRRGIGGRQDLGYRNVDDEGEIVPPVGLLDHRYTRRARRQRPGELEAHPPDLRQAHVPNPVGGLGDRELGVTGEPRRLLPVLNLEPWGTHPPTLALASQEVEEIAVRPVQIGQRLLQRHRRNLTQPGPLLSAFSRGQRRRQLRPGWNRLPSTACGLPDSQGVVEHHPGASEHPGQRALLVPGGVGAVPVTLEHISTVGAAPDILTNLSAPGRGRQDRPWPRSPAGLTTRTRG